MADVADTITQDAHSIKLVTTGVDANADKSAGVIDLKHADYAALWAKYGYPKRITAQAARTAGGTDVVEVGVEATNISSTVGFTQIIKAVSSTGEDLVGEEDLVAARYWRMHTVTVGAGNTLTVTIVISFV